jgi:hypothetical protein
VFVKRAGKKEMVESTRKRMKNANDDLRQSALIVSLFCLRVVCYYTNAIYSSFINQNKLFPTSSAPRVCSFTHFSFFFKPPFKLFRLLISSKPSVCLCT